VYIEDHVGSVKTDRCIGVCRQIIEQLFCFGHCELCSFQLLARYHAECHEHSEVDSAGVVEDAPNDALDMFDVCVAEEGRCVGREGTLGFAAKLFRLGSVGTILKLWQGGMLVFLQLFDDVAQHGNVEGACILIPFEVYAAVEVAVPILGEFIFLFDAHDKVVDIFLTRIFHAEIVNNKCEGDGACRELPEARRLLAFEISVGGKVFLEELVGQDAGLGKSPHGTLHFQINVSVEDFVL
jgi:hypothetical protein